MKIFRVVLKSFSFWKLGELASYVLHWEKRNMSLREGSKRTQMGHELPVSKC